MRPEVDLPGYETPFCLFGNAPPVGAARSLTDLVRLGLLQPADAEQLTALARRRMSLAIVAPGVARGKSTLLAALLPWLPAGCDRYFLRGSFETFRFTRLPTWRPANAVLIANEMSDHLPVYLPDHQRGKVFAQVAAGASLWTTAHASGPAELLARWPDWPMGAPLAIVTLHDERLGLTIDRYGPIGRG